MLTREVREWLKKVERGQYSYESAISEFINFSAHLTREEMVQLKLKLKNSYKS